MAILNFFHGTIWGVKCMGCFIFIFVGGGGGCIHEDNTESEHVEYFKKVLNTTKKTY